MTITVCVVDINGGPKKDGSNCKKNAGKESPAYTTRHPRTFWGRQPEKVSGTDSCPDCVEFDYLMGPSLVMKREMTKATIVVRSKVLGKVHR